MALTATTTINKASRTYEQGHGLKIAHARITIGAVTDYVIGAGTVASPTGLDVDTLLRRICGMNSIIAVVGATLRTATTGVAKLFVPFYDYLTGRLRFFEANTTFDEIDQADLTAATPSDFIDCIVIGIA